MKRSPVKSVSSFLSGFFGSSRGNVISQVISEGEHEIDDLFSDFNDLLDQFSHRELLNAGRMIYNNFGIVTGAVDDIARSAVGDKWKAQYDGTDRVWGKSAEDWLEIYSSIADVRGAPFGLRENKFLEFVTLIRDGEYFVLKTRISSHLPAFQFIESHRIGNRYERNGKIENGRFAGYILKNGIVYTHFGKAVAYKYLGESESQDEWIEAKDIDHVFIPKYFSQGRGISPLIAGLADWLAVNDWKKNESLAHVLASTIVFTEKNETGKMNPTKAVFEKVGERNTASGTTVGDYVKKFTKGATRFLRFGKEDAQVFDTGNRPSANERAFIECLIRGALLALGWSYEQGYDSKGLTGPSVRRDIEKCQKTINHLQGIVARFYRSQVVYLIAVADSKKLITDEKRNPIKLPVDWHKWKPELPRKMSIDLGRDGKTEVELMKSGMINEWDYHREYAGGDYDDHLDKKIKAHQARVQKLVDAGIEPTRENMREVFGSFDPNPDKQKQETTNGKDEDQ